jgi:hypothetical protein
LASARGTQWWPSLFFVHLLTIIPPVPERRGGLAFAVQSPWPLPTPLFLLKINALSQILERPLFVSGGRRQPQRHPTRRELWIRPGAAYHALDEEKESWSLHLFTRFLRTREERPRRKRGGKTRDLYHKPRSRVGLPSLRGWEYTIRDRYKTNDW